jgi:ADP-ribose pyrophosphatase YjhB (NUDIX family)
MPDPALRLLEIADQLRALATNGLHFTDDPYQAERYRTILDLSGQLIDLADARPLRALQQVIFNDLGWRSPGTGVDTAVFDDQSRILLVQRADNELWATPGGGCEVGESAATTGAREVWEETGYQVEVTDLLGIFDSRRCGSRSVQQLYHILVTGRVIGGKAATSNETLDVRWFAADELPWTKLSPGHEPRIRFALGWQAAPNPKPFFDPAKWSPPSD